MNSKWSFESCANKGCCFPRGSALRCLFRAVRRNDSVPLASVLPLSLRLLEIGPQTGISV